MTSGIGDDDNASFTISGDQMLSNEMFNFEVKTSYTILVQTEDQEGLVYSKPFEIIIADVLEPLLIPKIFTPNNDGNNDYFEIPGLEEYPDNSITIYNRWGNIVYQASNYQNNWDGTSNVNTKLGNNLLPVGVYYYILRLTESEEKSGALVLER